MIRMGLIFAVAVLLSASPAGAQFGMGNATETLGCRLNAIAQGSDDCAPAAEEEKDVCAAAVDQLRLDARALSRRLIREWRARFRPADPFDPLGPPGGVNPWGTLQAAINQYARDMEDLRRGRPSRWQRAEARGTPRHLRTGMLDRASALATQRYMAMDAAIRARLAEPGCGGALAQALRDGGRDGWEREAAAAGVPYDWDGAPRR